MFPSYREWRVAYRSLSQERLFVVWILLLLGGACVLSGILVINRSLLVEIPKRGGTINEGIIGIPRFINPVLAVSPQDSDLTTLVHAGVMKLSSTGVPQPDLAERVEESEDGLTYTVTLKSWARFHDGEAVTADDIIFTVSLIQNPNMRSPLAIEWEGVGTEKVDERTVRFTLRQPFPRFLHTLTVGVLPRHIWKDLSPEEISLSDQNLHAIGAGPFAIDDITLSAGIPKQIYLKSHKYYTLGRPYINELVIHTYQNERMMLSAYEDGEITRVHGISGESVPTLSKVKDITPLPLLPRTFTVFLNPNKNDALIDKNLRKALSLAIDRDRIVREIYFGYATSTTYPYVFLGENTLATSSRDEATSYLSMSAPYKKSSTTLEVTLTVGNSEENRKIAEYIQEDWQSLGVKTNIDIYEFADLNQNIIRERNFEALFTGTLVRSVEDLYPFWHSSQRKFPGLNLSGYVSSKLDSALEALRREKDEEKRREAIASIIKEFDEESPSLFLFVPELVYLYKDEAVSPLPLVAEETGSRFALIHEWYLYRERVWNLPYSKELLTTIEAILH